jgi:sulfite exporter TauE/SafE
MKEKFFDKLIASLDTNKGGFSGRKLSAITVMTLVITGHILFFIYATKHDKWELWIEVLMLDYGMIAVLLGLTTWENVKIKKDEKKPDDNNANTPAN